MMVCVSFISPLLDGTKWIHFPTLYLLLKLLSFCWFSVRLQVAGCSFKCFSRIRAMDNLKAVCSCSLNCVIPTYIIDPVYSYSIRVP